ncbi:MAG: hypothetical protein QM668_19380 [Agriterribacter sp.]
MSNINIGNAPPDKVVLPFYATGAFVFWLLCLLLLADPGSLTQHHFNPHLLAIVHMAALGWGTMIIMGAAHQLLPVICERDLFNPVLASVSWYFLTAGIIFLAYAFWNMQTGWLMISGGVLVVLSALAYFINTAFTGSVFIHYSVVRLFIFSSAFWLLFTTLIGLLLAINLRYVFFTKNHLELLKLHAHAGLAGWFLQLIAGVSSKLVPMFLLGKSDKEKLLLYAFILQNAGLLLFLFDGYFFEMPASRMLVYAVLVAAGITCLLLYLYDAFRNRVRKKADIQMKQTFLSFLGIVIAILLVPFVLYANDSRWGIGYGAFLFMGWITGLILGKTFKTLPFIVWNRHYKNLSGKAKIPLPKNLYSEALVQWQFRIFIAAMVLLAAGILMNNTIIVQVASVFWLLLATIYLFNVMKVLLHKKTLLS